MLATMTLRELLYLTRRLLKVGSSPKDTVGVVILHDSIDRATHMVATIESVSAMMSGLDELFAVTAPIISRQMTRTSAHVALWHLR